MDRLSILTTGFALAVTFAVVNATCAIVVAIWPVQATDFANAWMHGLDLDPIRSSSPLTWAGVAYGVVGLSLAGFVVGAVFAWIYNLIAPRGS